MPDLFIQAGEPGLRIVPQDCWFDSKIDVGEDIAKPCNLPPVSIRVSFLEIKGKVLDRLTYDLKVPDNGIPAPPVSDKIIVRYAGSILFYIPDRVKESSSNGRADLCIHDLVEDVRFEPFFKCILHDKIDLSPEEIFEIELTVHIIVERLFSFPEGDQHIHIAVRPLLSPCKGTEYANRCNTEPLPEDWLVLPEERNDIHMVYALLMHLS